MKYDKLGQCRSTQRFGKGMRVESRLIYKKCQKNFKILSDIQLLTNFLQI